MLKLDAHKTFTIEEEIIQHLMLQTISLKRNGLLYGKLGIVITFFLCGYYWNNPIYTDFAKELKNSLPNKIDNKIPLDFATGLCGFGWGIEYLVQNHFVDDDSDKICTVIDQRIMIMNLKRITDISLKSGLEGFLHYFLIRLKGEKMRGNSQPFDAIYLNDIYDRLQSFPESSLKRAFISYMDTGSLTYTPDISLFTNDLHIQNEKDILSAKLGLSDGLAGKLVRMVNEQKSYSL